MSYGGTQDLPNIVNLFQLNLCQVMSISTVKPMVIYGHGISCDAVICNHLVIPQEIPSRSPDRRLGDSSARSPVTGSPPHPSWSKRPSLASVPVTPWHDMIIFDPSLLTSFRPVQTCPNTICKKKALLVLSSRNLLECF